MKYTYLVVLLFVSLLSFSVKAQEGIPEKPKTERLVTDFADVLTEQEERHLEAKLVQYYRESSTQVAVVTVKSLNGYERADFAVRLAQKWGIGSAKHDNGILLLVKPKYADSKGQVFVATGYGLEGKATDLANGQIVRNLIIPQFQRNDYFGGIDKGTTALIALTKGEYNDKTFPPEKKTKFPFGLIFIGFIFLFFLLSSKKQKANGQFRMDKNGGAIPTYLLLEMLMRGGRGGSNFDDFSSGGGDFGGFGGGGFGGFGGGSFGGGGAGGSW